MSERRPGRLTSFILSAMPDRWWQRLVGAPDAARPERSRCSLAWVLIFGAAFVVFTLRDDFRALGNRVLAEVTRRRAVRRPGRRDLRIRQARRRPFLGRWRDQRPRGPLPGRQRRHDDHDRPRRPRERAGIAAERRLPAMVDTANGIVMVDRGRAERLEVGPIERSDIRRPHRRAFGDINVLGMNFLSSLSALGGRGAHAGAAAVTAGNAPSLSVCILHNVYYRTFRWPS